MIIIFISFETKVHAEKVAHYLIDKHLAACVSLIPVTSYYSWKGKKMTPDEFEAIVKTKKENFGKIEKAVEDLLPYEIPQLIGIDVRYANDKYLDWLKKQIE